MLMFNRCKIILLYLIILLCNASGPFLVTIMQIALPNIANNLHIEYSDLTLVLAVYFLFFSTFSLPLGKLGDAIGSKIIFCFGFILFCISGLLIYFFNSIASLVLFRSFQGIGIAAVSSNGLSIMRQLSNNDDHGKITAYWSSSISIGYIVGPFLGGFLLNHYTFNSVYLIVSFIDFILLVLVILFFPNNSKASRKKYNYFESILLSLIIFGIILQVKPLPIILNYKSLRIILFIINIMLVIFFVFNSKKQKSNYFNWKYFLNKDFIYGITNGIILAFTIQSFNYIFQFIIQDIYKISSSISGSLWALMSIATLLSTIIFSRKSKKYGNHNLILFSTLFRMLALGLLFVISNDIVNIILIILCVFIYGIGMGLSSSPINSHLLEIGKKSETGTMLGMYTTIRTLSSSFGIIITGYIFSNPISIINSNSNGVALILTTITVILFIYNLSYKVKYNI